MSEPRLTSPRVGMDRRSRVVTRILRWAPLLLLAIPLHAATQRVLQWQRAARILGRFSASESHATDAVPELPGERAFPFATTPTDVLRWIEYRPAAPRAALVLVHGVQYLGIHEPRLVRFARSLASEGVLVVTPELPELADYRIDPRSIDRIGLVTQDLARRVGHPVGVVGT
ncbi:hypothetical protein EON77_07675, partial [bacterium]